MTPSLQSPTRSLPRPSILLVADRPADLDILRGILEELGYPLVETTSSEAALQHLRANEFAVILLDTQQDGPEVFKTAQLIRAQTAQQMVPLIFLAPPGAQAVSPVKMYTLGAVDYLVKPPAAAILRAKVTRLVELFSEKQQAEHQAEQLRLLIADTTDYAIFLLDPDGHIVSWNAGAERLKGYRTEEIIGRHFSVFYPQEAIDRHWPDQELQAARAQGRFEDEGWRLRKDGSRFWANVVITALRDSDGKLLGFSKITRDLTERKKAEEALREAHAELEQRVQQRTAELARANEALADANRLKDDFLAMLAHELRNPLTPIRNGIQIMKMPGLGTEAIRQAREMIERQVQHLVRIVDDLLDVSRIMRDKIELRREDVELSTVFARAVETANPMIETQGQELNVTLPDEPLHVQGDVVRLAQIVSNLLVNAAKYTDKAGRIWLSGAREGADVVIRVRDTGVGIDPQLLPRIFDLFVQADRSLARSQGGLGVGLTLVRRLVELHGGSVSASSAGLGRGSEFVVRLPALPPRPPEAITAEEERIRKAAAPRRVLVVDDNVDAAESAAMLLRFLGHEVEIAHDGLTALDAVRDFRPEILLLDIGLPGMSGYEVARALRARPENKGLVLAAVTGYGQDEDRRRSREAGFDYHLTKPLAPQTLTSLVDARQGPVPAGSDSSTV